MIKTVFLILAMTLTFVLGCMADENEKNVFREFKDCPECPEMVVLPKGKITIGVKENHKFTMPYYLPQQDITFDYNVAVGKFEITRGNYYQCYAEKGCSSMPDETPMFARAGIKVKVPNQTGSKLPMNYVSWDMVQEYLVWISRKTGRDYRLLSESEWEYAARAGSDTEYFWGDKVDPQYVLFRKNSLPNTRKNVDSMLPNKFGVYSTLGGMREWVEDCHSLGDIPENGSAKIEGGNCSARVKRGGGVIDGEDKVTVNSRAFNRLSDNANRKDSGFRVATRDIKENQ